MLPHCGKSSGQQAKLTSCRTATSNLTACQQVIAAPLPHLSITMTISLTLAPHKLLPVVDVVGDVLCRWLPVSAGSNPDQAPCERMCHSLTPLPDGRLLLLGGRHKEGICKDLWWLDTVSSPAIDNVCYACMPPHCCPGCNATVIAVCVMVEASMDSCTAALAS